MNEQPSYVIRILIDAFSISLTRKCKLHACHALHARLPIDGLPQLSTFPLIVGGYSLRVSVIAYYVPRNVCCDFDKRLNVYLDETASIAFKTSFQRDIPMTLRGNSMANLLSPGPICSTTVFTFRCHRKHHYSRAYRGANNAGRINFFNRYNSRQLNTSKFAIVCLLQVVLKKKEIY